jgi:hypothetical protein
LLETDTAGDPMGRRGLWTAKRLAQISQELSRWGLSGCAHTVSRLLAQLDYGLHANRKSLSGKQSPHRDQPFRYLPRQQRQFARQELPRVSVDSQKKELVGPFKNAGRVWSRAPIPVHDHDFPSLAQGVAWPRCLYDLPANRGAVLVGTSHDTLEFAVDALVLWWRTQGRRRYPPAAQLLLLADSGGSNSARCRLWKYALQEKLVDPYHLTVTVCHDPPGASKWKPVEHRLLSEISKHWAGHPLYDYPTVVRLIRETRTRTGLRVTCRLSTKDYPTGRKVTEQQMRQLNLRKHQVLPQWNYTLSPRTNGN